MPDLRRTNKCTCLFCFKQFAALASRIRAHVGQIKGQDVFVCPGVKKQPEETEQCFEIRRAQFQNAKDRCLAAAAEKESLQCHPQEAENTCLAESGSWRDPWSLRV